MKTYSEKVDKWKDITNNVMSFLLQITRIIFDLFSQLKAYVFIYILLENYHFIYE